MSAKKDKQNAIQKKIEPKAAQKQKKTTQPSADNQKTELEKAQKKAHENWELLLRAKAETENIKRRAQIDVQNAHKFALEKFVKELIPVIDSFEQGILAIANDEKSDPKHKEGMDMAMNLFLANIKKFSVEQINPIKQPFNPQLHEAMTMQETKEAKPNTVLQVFQKGYTLNERVIRPARVIVAKAASENTAEAEQQK